MRNLRGAALLLLLSACGVVSSCSQSDKQEARQELRKSGIAVKKELKTDAKFLKEQAIKARAETQKGVKELKKELNDDAKPDPAASK